MHPPCILSLLTVSLCRLSFFYIFAPPPPPIMSGKKRRRLKELAETTAEKEPMTNAETTATMELQSWSDLPVELLELVMSCLTLEENIRASAVCKSWYSVAIATRVLNQTPWIMFFPKVGDTYEFYYPLPRKTYCVELPELCGSRVCSTVDGWLLLYQPRTHCVFFFNPFTRESIQLPRFEMSYQIVSVSAPPTAANCLVFTIKHISPTVVAISTCHAGASEWTTVNHQNRLPFVSSIWNKLVYCNGLFYCLSLTGWLGAFDPDDCSWDVLSIHPPKCPENFFIKNWWKGKFMLEHKGELFVIYTCSTENPIIFKLDRNKLVWEEMKTLDGMTIFASFLSSHGRTDLPGKMRNNVFFSKVRFYGKRCISYSLDDCRYYPRKQYHDWGEQDPFESIWVVPPENFAAFS